MQAIIARTNTTEKKLKKKDSKMSESSISRGKSLNVPSLMTMKSEKKSLQTMNQLLKDSTQLDNKQNQNLKVTWMEMMDDKIMAEHQLKFEVNFDWDVFEIIHEAELFEQMGFELPEAVRDVGIQKNRLRSDIDDTQIMIKEYNGTVAKLNTADVRINYTQNFFIEFSLIIKISFHF